MDTKFTPETSLPSYDGIADELVEPISLIIDRQEVLAFTKESPPTALYQLDRGVANLGSATSQVTLERIGTQIRTDSEGNASLKPRNKLIYNLKYAPSNSPSFYIQQASRQSIGSIGLKKSRLHKQWKALPVDISGKSNQLKSPQFIKDSLPSFIISNKGDVLEWQDTNGIIVAHQHLQKDQHQLDVQVALKQNTLDALVALWCCHVWEFSMTNQPEIYKGLDKGMLLNRPKGQIAMANKRYFLVRRKLWYSRELPGRGRAAWVFGPGAPSIS